MTQFQSLAQRVLERTRARVKGESKDLRILALILNIYYWTGILPFRWGIDGSGHLGIRQTLQGLARRAWYARALLTNFGFGLFALIRLLQFWDDFMTPTYKIKFVSHLIITIAWIFYGLLYFRVYWYLDRIPELVNGIDLMKQRVKERLGSRYQGRTLRAGFLVTCQFIQAVLATTAYGMSVLATVEHKVHLASVVNDPWSQSNLGQTLTLVLVEVYCAFSVCGILNFEHFFHVRYFSTMNRALRNLRDPGLRGRILDVKAVYQTLKVMNCVYDELYSRLAVPCMTFIFGSIPILEFYAILTVLRAETDEASDSRFYIFMWTSSALGVLIYQLPYYPQAARIHESSLRVSEGLGSHGARNRDRDVQVKGHGKFEAAHLQSLAPIQVAVGNFFRISRETPLTFLGIVVNQTVGLLLSF